MDYPDSDNSKQRRGAMKNAYEVTIQATREVHSLPGIWTAQALRQLLGMADFEDAHLIEESELLEMVVMALQDLGNQAAGELVLEAVFGETMRPGVRQNLVDDLQEDQPWADFAEVSQQRGLFIAVVLLHRAFPNRYGTPDAMQVRFSVRALAGDGVRQLAAAAPAWIVRLLASGMQETDILHRLFEDDLAGGPFKDAPGIIWHCEGIEDGGGGSARVFELIASRQWFGPLKEEQTFVAKTPG